MPLKQQKLANEVKGAELWALAQAAQWPESSIPLPASVLPSVGWLALKGTLLLVSGMIWVRELPFPPHEVMALNSWGLVTVSRTQIPGHLFAR